jgi:FkbH-like protein
MVLKWSDFAAVRVNWDAKAQNLAAIASQLRLGLDSFAFFDDSDYELDSVRRCLPQVRCLKVPGEAWQIPMVIPASRLFDKLSVTDEDRHRSETYTSARLRTELESTAESHDAFLRQLEMVVTIERFDAGLHLRRAAQLTQRTNQFNLTTRRHSEAELSSAIEQGALVFMGSLRDRFGDYGRVLLAVLQPIDDRILRLDTFLMSCRAIGRNVEIVWMRALLQSVKRQGWGELRAEYIPTAKNGVCENFLTVCGFLPVEGGSGAARQYWLDLSQPITVEDQTIELETIV